MKEPKYRHEFKYLITNAQLALLKARARAVMKPDSHTGDGGIYNIRSLYFDDCDNTCFYENENGTDPREKLRIRIYNHSPERITLECKRKERGKTLKTSCRLTKEQTQALMDGRIPQGEHPPLLAKLCVYMNVRRMRPAIIVEYDRIPYDNRAGNVRVAFDTNISSSSKIDGFLSGDVPKRLVLPSGMQLLEVKYDEFFPDHIYRALQLGELEQTAFSKYYLCRKYSF